MAVRANTWVGEGLLRKTKFQLKISHEDDRYSIGIIVDNTVVTLVTDGNCICHSIMSNCYVVH